MFFWCPNMDSNWSQAVINAALARNTQVKVFAWCTSGADAFSDSVVLFISFLLTGLRS